MDKQFNVANSTLAEQFSYHGFATYETRLAELLIYLMMFELYLPDMDCVTLAKMYVTDASRQRYPEVWELVL